MSYKDKVSVVLQQREQSEPNEPKKEWWASQLWLGWEAME